MSKKSLLHGIPFGHNLFLFTHLFLFLLICRRWKSPLKKVHIILKDLNENCSLLFDEWCLLLLHLHWHFSSAPALILHFIPVT